MGVSLFRVARVSGQGIAKLNYESERALLVVPRGISIFILGAA
jgi:hypothetical protein